MFSPLIGKYRDLQDKRANGEGGFTLIELLVVVVIIGILIAIAIPLYLNYQHGAKDKSAMSDLRAAIATVNQCYADNNSSGYPTTSSGGVNGVNMTFACGTGGTTTETANVSGGTTLTYTSGGTSFSMTATNSGGSGVTYGYNSANGGTIAPTTAASAPASSTASTPTS